MIGKNVTHAMTPMENVFVLEENTLLDQETLKHVNTQIFVVVLTLLLSHLASFIVDIENWSFPSTCLQA